MYEPLQNQKKIPDLRYFTVEELYVNLDNELDKMVDITFKNSGLIILYLSELYRKGIQWPPHLDWWNYDVDRGPRAYRPGMVISDIIVCEHRLSSRLREVLSRIKPYVKTELTKLRKIKTLQGSLNIE